VAYRVVDESRRGALPERALGMSRDKTSM